MVLNLNCKLYTRSRIFSVAYIVLIYWLILYYTSINVFLLTGVFESIIRIVFIWYSFPFIMFRGECLTFSVWNQKYAFLKLWEYFIPPRDSAGAESVWGPFDILSILLWSREGCWTLSIYMLKSPFFKSSKCFILMRHVLRHVRHHVLRLLWTFKLSFIVNIFWVYKT